MLPVGGYFVGDCSNVTDRSVAYFVERAKGGVGLIIIGITLVTPVDEPITKRYFNMHEKWLLPGHYHLTEAVHLHGAKIGIQLGHAGVQQIPHDLGGKIPLSPSGIRQFNVTKEPYPEPRAMTRSEIHQIIEYFSVSGANAKSAGYDLVEIHGAHGYLLSAFMSPALNKRTDEFGGSVENRFRFTAEIIKGIHKLTGDDYPVCVRLNAEDWIPGGMTIGESSQGARILQDAGAACINIGMGMYESFPRMNDVMRMEEGWKLPYWAKIKGAVTIPTIAGGGNRHAEFCEKILAEGKANFVGMARQFLADPYWPQKVREGKTGDINYCISCLRCLFAPRGAYQVVRHCTVNAMWGRELEFATPKPAVKKKIMVVGGGPAGIEAARVASLRGHEVTLYEKGQELGGQLLIASRPPGKQKMLWPRDYMVSQIKKQGVKVVLSTEVTPDMVAKAEPDAVIVATGAEPECPDFPGIDSVDAVSAWDVLLGKAVLTGKKVCVLGGGMVGAETAEFLAEKHCGVTVVEMLDLLAGDMEPINQRILLDSLAEHHVATLVRKKIVEFNAKGAVVEDIGTGEKQLIEADTFVVACGSAPVRALIKEIEAIVPEVYTAGDCREPRTALEAIAEGFLIGNHV